MYKFRADTCILVGDTHSIGATYDILNIDIPNGYDVVHLGDAGFGFGEKEYAIRETLWSLERYNTLCEKIDINLYIIRGNHDAPYDEIWGSTHNRVFLIKDHEYGVFPNGKKVLFLGGGISVDRFRRKPGIDYWQGEITQPIEVVEECDIVFSHDCPEHFNHSTKTLPNHYGWYCERDVTLMDEALKQRLNVSDIVSRKKAKVLFGGHFHNSNREEKDGVYYRCLDINERFEFDSNKEYKL